MRLSILNISPPSPRQPVSELREFYKERMKNSKPFWERRDELEAEDIEAEFKKWKRDKIIDKLLDDEKENRVD